MKYLIVVSLLIAQVACVGTNKPRPDMALYDFGYAIKSDSKPLLTKTEIEPVTANEMLNYQKMRYRLEYVNPARVFYFTESRWIVPPAELVNNQLNALVNTQTQSNSKPFNCSLKLKLQVFDQVFNSKDSSAGVVQINAILLAKNTKQLVMNEVINESALSKNPNAEGGAKALAKASENALVKAVNWANAQATQNTICNN